MEVSAVVSTHWLNEQIQRGRSESLVILDATWYSGQDAMEDFSRRHIPGAVHFNIFGGVELTPLYPRKLADAATFETNTRGAAVNNSSHVVIYGGCSGKYGFFTGGRLFLMFKVFGHTKVSVLDGGLEKWIADGYQTTDMCIKKLEGDFTVKPDYKWCTTYEDMVKNLATRTHQICDSRPSDIFKGTANDPKSGHYPDAVNIPFTFLFNEDSRDLKDVDELRQVFSDAGIDLSRPITGMCKSGMSSCSLALAAHLCGCTDVSLYFGGFTEWKIKASEDAIHQG